MSAEPFHDLPENEARDEVEFGVILHRAEEWEAREDDKERTSSASVPTTTCSEEERILDEGEQSADEQLDRFIAEVFNTPPPPELVSCAYLKLCDLQWPFDDLKIANCCTYVHVGHTYKLYIHTSCTYVVHTY